MKRQAWTVLVGREDSDFATLYYGLDEHYLQMLRLVEVEFGPDASSDHLLRAQIELVIWGCLMIESTTNRLRRQVLVDLRVPPGLIEDYWKRIERDRINDKLKVVGKHFGFAVPDWVSGEVDLRNRLAHYKNEGAVFNRAKERQAWEGKGAPGEFLEHLPPLGIHADLIALPPAERKIRFINFGTEMLTLADQQPREHGHYPDVDPK